MSKEAYFKYQQRAQQLSNRLSKAFEKGVEKLLENSQEFQKIFGKSKLPRFYLIKNLSIGSINLESTKAFVNGEIISSSKDCYELQKLIPKVKIPTDECSSYKLLENYDCIPKEIRFDDSPYALFDEAKIDEYSDKELFGKSYTIVWVCNDNPEVILKEIISHIKNEIMTNNKDCIKVLLEAWQNYHDRLCIFTEKKNAEDIKNKVTKGFKIIIANIEGHPTEYQWNQFEQKMLKIYDID